MELFVEQDLLALPVVDDHKERHVIGLVRRPTWRTRTCGICTGNRRSRGRGNARASPC